MTEDRPILFENEISASPDDETEHHVPLMRREPGVQGLWRRARRYPHRGAVGEDRALRRDLRQG